MPLLGALQENSRKNALFSQRKGLPKKQKSLETVEFQGFFMELLGRFELPTSSLPT